MSTEETPTPAQPAQATPASAKKRRFGGTVAQIRTALMFYRVMAYVTGVMLLLLTIEMVIRYGFGYMLAAGGTSAATGQAFGLGFVHVNEDGTLPLIGAFNLSLFVLIAHGWLYVVYILADFRLWSLMRWNFMKFVLIALGGVVPFLSFFVEARIAKQVEAEVKANPQASKRY